MTILVVRLNEGIALSSDEVCVRVHTTIELKKNSVPPLSVLNWNPGDCAGHTVNPGCVAPTSLGR